jgi:hypothetical protein
MRTIIYKITNPINQTYIGSTNRRLCERKAEHKYSIKRNRKGLIYDSFNLFGFDNHIFELITEIENDEKKELEHFIIETFNPELNLVVNYNATAKNKIWVNDGEIEFQIFESEFYKYSVKCIKGRLINPFKKK